MAENASEGHANSSSSYSDILSMLNKFESTSTPKPSETRKRPRCSRSPESIAGDIQNMNIDLDDATPDWACKMVKGIQSMFLGLEANLSQAVDFATETATDAQTLAGTNGKRLKCHDVTLSAMQQQLTKLARENTMLKDKLVTQDSRNRKDNIVFRGVPENRGESCDKIIRDVIRQTGIDPNNVKLSACHRLGRPGSEKPRPILTRFHFNGDRVKVMQGRKILEKCKIYLSDDYPPEVVSRRNQLYPILKYAKNIPKYKDKSWLSSDKLIIDGKSYSIHTLHTLPTDLDPRLISTPTKDDSTVFFGCNSPLSNHHPSPFTLDSIQYSCVEQYLMTQKAALFNAMPIYLNIMTMTDPVDMKRAAHGKNIQGYNQEAWHNAAPNILQKALLAKYTQNVHLHHFLLSTDKYKLGEATDDPFWGIGMRLGNPNVHKTSLWKDNLMGQTSEYVRQHLMTNKPD